MRAESRLKLPGQQYNSRIFGIWNSHIYCTTNSHSLISPYSRAIQAVHTSIFKFIIIASRKNTKLDFDAHFLRIFCCLHWVNKTVQSNMGFLTWKIQDGVQFQHPRGRNLISYYLAAISVDIMNADWLPPWIRQKWFLFNHFIFFSYFKIIAFIGHK